jgi:hypothetical protein
MGSPNKTILYKLEKKIVEHFKRSGEERDIPIKKIELDTDGIHLYSDDDNEYRILKWSDIWTIAFTPSNEFGDSFTFGMIKEDFLDLSSDHLKVQNEDFNKLLQQNLLNYKEGNAITWNVIKGDYHLIYIEKKVDQ